MKARSLAAATLALSLAAALLAAAPVASIAQDDDAPKKEEPKKKKKKGDEDEGKKKPTDGEEPEVVKKTRADLDKIKKDLEELRGVKFKSPVNVHYQTDEDFRKYLQGELDREFPKEKAEAYSRAYGRIGLLPDKYDLRKELVETMSAQAAAYYEPRKKDFYVLKADLPEMIVPGVMLHELNHALQDQHHDLGALLEKASKDDNDDAEVALKFLIEGEAEYLNQVYTAKRMGGNEEMIVDALLKLAKLSRKEMEQMERANLGMLGEKGKSLEKALDQRAKLPLSLFRSLVEPYVKGPAMIARVKRDGGWEAVEGLWKDLPRSTSQVLRPARKLIGDAREDPTAVELPDASQKLGEGWKRTFQNTVGELGLEVLLEEKLGDDEDSKRPARGWIGDRVHAYEAEGKPTAIVWFLTWSRDGYAKRFAEAYARVLEKKYGDAKEKDAELSGKKAKVREDGEMSHAVAASGKDVVIVEACPKAALEAVVAAAFEAKKTPSKTHPAKAGKDGEK